MKTTIIIKENSVKRRVEVKSGELLSSALNLHAAKLDMPCAGKGICKSCVVIVNGEKRLACQTKTENGMVVNLVNSSEIKNIATMASAAAATTHTPIYGDSNGNGYGVAIDIGTTTLCAALLDKRGIVSGVTRKNPQTAFGADVISRIEKSLNGGAKELAECVCAALSEMITELTQVSAIRPADIGGAVITGNTAMLFLLTEHDPEALSHAPFETEKLFGVYIDAKDIGLGLSPSAKTYLPRCVSAFVGGDITTAIIASGMCEKGETALLVDIGTNGEIVLWQNGRLDCCSTAAGPAFEGAGISCGVYSINGAIDHVWLEDGEVRCSTIGAAKAVGVCGSGIIDAISIMLKLEIIDETGAFTSDSDCFEIADGISITAQDVRKIQLAKGSVRAGIETLLETAGVDKDDLSALYIAGGFGSFINLDNAAAIGLIPSKLLNQAKVIGNASHDGAAMLLQDKALIEKSEKLAARSNTVALDSNPAFADNYMAYMMFDQA